MKTRMIATAQAGFAAALLIIAASACQTERQTDPPPQAPQVDPADSDQPNTREAVNLRTNQIRTRHLFANSVTSGKVAIKAVAITVNAAATTGSSAADTDLESGFLIGCRPTGNQDQHIDNVVLNANGSITVTLAAAATANNTFSCSAIRADAKGVS